MALLDCLVSQNEQRKISNNPFRIMLPLVRYSWLPSVRVRHLTASQRSGTASAYLRSHPMEDPHGVLRVTFPKA